jgi:uncharacterized protein involved in exopolysaccharide biosynthesis
MNENNLNSREPQAQPQEEESMVDFKQLWTLVVSHWHWIVASVIACVLIAGIYLWFTPSTVTVAGKMEIIDKSKKGSGMSAGLAMLNSFPMGLGSSLGGAVGAAGSVDAEKEIILSNTLVTNVVKDLKLYTEYRRSKWGRKTLLYQNNPVEVSLDDAHVAWLDAELPMYNHQIKLTITKDDEGYTVEPLLIENKDKTEMPAQTFAQLPAEIKTDAGILTLTENKLTPKQAKPFEGGYTLKVTIAPPTKVADAFIARTGFEAPSKKVTNMANVSLTDENAIRGIDYVTHLVEAYNKRANDDKNEEARKTDEFVNARLAMVDAELGSSDAAWENSKKNFQITTPEVDAEEALTKKSLYEAQLVEIGTQLQLHDFLNEYVNNPANLYEIIPSGLAVSVSSAAADGKGGASASSGNGGNAALISQHNALVNQRKDLLKSVSEMSPQVQRVTESIKELHPTLQLAMKRDRQQLIMKKDAVNREYAKYAGRIGSAPQMERVLTEIGRQREIKQGVYLLMLQKREETAMELANVTDKGKLIDPPTIDPTSGKPQKKMVLLVALFLGAILPVGVLYLLQMFKTKVDTRDELAAATSLPILAEVDKSNVDDAIRTLRTNLLLNLKEGQKTILVASNNTGDGKTFIAKKLEETFTAIGKKAAFIPADLRSGSCQLSIANCQLPKGTHPADILASAEFAAQVAQAKADNDVVILDSPAISEYNDAYQLAAFADATLYVAKAGKTQKSDLESLNSNSNLPNPLIVFNV